MMLLRIPLHWLCTLCYVMLLDFVFTASERGQLDDCDMLLDGYNTLMDVMKAMSTKWQAVSTR